jgi:hypothetical protein
MTNNDLHDRELMIEQTERTNTGRVPSDKVEVIASKDLRQSPRLG